MPLSGTGCAGFRYEFALEGLGDLARCAGLPRSWGDESERPVRWFRSTGVQHLSAGFVTYPFAEPEQPPPRRRGSPFRVFRRVVLLLLASFFLLWLWFRVAAAGLVCWAWPRRPPSCRCAGGARSAPRSTGRAEGPSSRRLYQPVPIESIAPITKTAALVAEDHRFYAHDGIDYVEFRHALGYRPDDFSTGEAPGSRRALAGASRSLSGTGKTARAPARSPSNWPRTSTSRPHAIRSARSRRR